jgi:hypothetical protein
LAAVPRESAIRSQLDQGSLLQYFAWAGQVIETGVALSVDNFCIEFWFNLTLQPVPDDDDLRIYPLALQNLGEGNMASIFSF